jgi:mRNA interferase ChpB
MRIPARGEIWIANLNPSAGREQQGMRPVFVVSERDFNRLGLCVVCPISQGAQQSRFAGFAVTLMGSGTQTQGVVMCNQPRTIDMGARNGQWVEHTSAAIADEVAARLLPIFQAV